MRIFLIGSGNVATQLGLAFKRIGHKIVFVYSPTASHAARLGKKLKTNWGTTLDINKYPADVYIIAVRDNAITEVIQKMPVISNALVIHTSGATDISVLKKKFRNCGVLWQAQTIEARTKIDFSKVPLVIEASNPPSKKRLRTLAGSLSKKIYVLTSHQRRVLHLGAVWVNNFPNHLYYLSASLLKKHKLPFELFGPLMYSTIEGALQDPYLAQTGPARRNDTKTMKAHLKLLPDKKYRNLYKILSKSITNLYN